MGSPLPFQDFDLSKGLQSNEKGKFDDFKLPEVPKQDVKSDHPIRDSIWNFGKEALGRIGDIGKSLLNSSDIQQVANASGNLGKPLPPGSFGDMPKSSIAEVAKNTLGYIDPTGMATVPIQAGQDIADKKYGSALGDIAIPAGLAALGIHKAMKGGLVEGQVPQVPGEVMGEVLPEGGGKEPLALPEKTSGARFVSGEKGVVDVNEPGNLPPDIRANKGSNVEYMGQPDIKSKFNDFSLPKTEIQEPGLVKSVEGEVLPDEGQIGDKQNQFPLQKQLGAPEEADIIPEDTQKLLTAHIQDEIQGKATPDTKQSFWQKLAGSSDEGAVKFGGPNPEPSHPLVTKLMNAILDAGPLRRQQEKLYSQERAARISNVENVTTPGVKGYHEQLGKLKGELPKVDYEGLKLQPKEVDSLIDMITNTKKLLPYEKITAKGGLMKILTGSGVPQTSELNLLRDVYGDEFGKVMSAHAGIPVTRAMVSDLANASKSIMASVDFSAPLRQGLPLIHTGQYWKSFTNMFSLFKSEKMYQDLQASIHERPGYLLGRESGLKLTDIGSDVTQREEAFASRAVEHLPFVRRSERAYVGFINKLRADVFDDLVSKAKDLGLEDPKTHRDIAKFVNNATGRGSLGPGEKIATELNNVFFSPRLMASRLTILNPGYYINATTFVRKEALKSLLAIAGAGMTAVGLGKLAGADINVNPVNSDFGKIRFGNTRVDPWGGFQQYIVAAARLLTGHDESTSGRTYNLNDPKYAGPSRLSVLGNFTESKLSPIASLVDTLLKGKTGDGKPIDPTSEVAQRYIPMLLQDLHDIYKDDPNHLPLGLAGAFGMGLQTFKNDRKPPSSKNIGSLPGLSKIKIN